MLNYTGQAPGVSRTRHVPSYTSRRFIWSTGVDNIINITVTREDRRPMNIINREIVFTFWDAKSGTTYFRRTASLVDPSVGQLRLIVPAALTADIPRGLYNLSATIVDSDGYETVLSWDQDQRGSFDVELKDDVMPPPKVTDVIDSWTLSDGIYVSSAIDGPTISTVGSGLFSVAVYATNYSGIIKIQGSLDQTMNGINTLWADLAAEGYVSSDLVLTDYTGIVPLNFRSNMRWIRAARTDDPGNTGTLDKILVRV